jgi:solute:Na+ symporter, SSS family
LISKIMTVVLVLASGYVASQLTSISQGWELVLNLGAGTGAVYILRWFWWRVNAWSEITAMLVAAAVAVALSRVHFSGNDAVVFAKSTLITAGITTLAWIGATFITRPESDSTLLNFYRRVHPTVHGWHRIAELAPEMTQVRDMSANAFDCVMGCVLVYGSLFGIGKLIFGEWFTGAMLLIAAVLAGYLIWRHLESRGWETLSGAVSKVSVAQTVEQ